MMPNYKEMYFKLFNFIRDAIEQIEHQNYGKAASLR